MGPVYAPISSPTRARFARRSPASKELLCDLHELIESRMPDCGSPNVKAYPAVRNAIFARAVEIIEETKGRRGFAAAKEWIDSLDLEKLDVRQLPGIGPKFEEEWRELVQQGRIRSFAWRAR